jgi:Family of unknown function (DUF6520)
MKNKKMAISVLAVLFAIASAFAFQKPSSARLVDNYQGSPTNCTVSPCGSTGNTLCTNQFSDLGCTVSITLHKSP